MTRLEDAHLQRDHDRPAACTIVFGTLVLNTEVHMCRTALLAALTTAITSSASLGQVPGPVRPGQRVRVESTVEHTPMIIGEIGAITADTIVVRHPGGTGAIETTAIPLSSIARVQASRGQHSKWLTGLGLGLGIGAGGGAIVGAATCEGDWLFTTGDCALMGAALFGAVGAVTGTVVGLLVKAERWETVSLDGLHVSIVPDADSFGIGVHIAF